MKNAARALVAILGLGSLFVGVSLWANQDEAIKQFAVQALNLVGRATIRADNAGLFIGMGVMMLFAARQASRSWALAAAVMASSALAGRIVTIALDGTGPGTWPPMIVEVVSIAILVWARSVWRTPD